MASSSSSSTVAANADLVWEILTWLPPRSVQRFRSVCRQWRDLSSTTFFVAIHTRRNPNKISGFIYTSSRCSKMLFEASCPLTGSAGGGVSRVFSASCPLDHFTMNQILQCCKGLLLGKGYDLVHRRWRLWVCNPTTNQHRILPSTENVEHAVMAFDPSRSAHYKVVFKSFCFNEINVYNSKDDSCDTISSQGLPHITTSSPWISCFCNGFVYWLHDDSGSLVSFDIDRRSFNVELTPPPAHNDCNSIQLYESRGRLRLFRRKMILLSSTIGVIEVLEMADDSSSWIQLHKVDVSEVMREIYGPALKWPFTSLGVFFDACAMLREHSWLTEGDDEKDDKLVIAKEDGYVAAYDWRSGTHEVIIKAYQRVTMLCSCANTLVAP